MKRRYTVNWEDQSCSHPTENWKTEEHELMIDSGCFGHVSPPWFAPQFPMMSSTNVEAVAANNVALQHYGQKVVYGHVMTNSGRRILIQITFDVRKPFLSTSALKHRGVTIIVNHDYDRVVFRNETLNLVSHDCHYYLHITLTNGIPPCKALVMAGESATHDVDEEVYGNDGAERHEAQEASAGDRRAIADADQAGQLNISGEAKTARILRTPEPPTDAMRMAHNATHVPFRDWCPSCVASRGRSSSHRRVVVNKTADTLPKFQTDYMFIRTVAQSKTQPCITFVETRSGVVISFMCARKGGYEDLTKEILRHFEAYGFLNPVITQCDKEMSIIDVCRKVARERNARTVLRFAPKTSHQSNGFVEAVHGHIQGLARCYQTQIETNTGIQLSTISPAIPFAIRYAGFVLTRFTVRPDGRTPFQYLLGTPYVSPLCMFGESVFALIPVHEVRAAKLTNRWVNGCWWGRDALSDEHLVETKHGLLKCRSVRRQPPGEQWSRRQTIEARGTKWNFDVEMDCGTLITSRRRDCDSYSIDGNSHSTSTRTSAKRSWTFNSQSQQQRRRRCGGQDGDGDLRPILRGSCENEGDWQSRPLHKQSRSAYSRPSGRGRQID